MTNAALLCYACECGLLLLHAFGGVGQEERPVNAGACPAHRIDILEIAFDNFNLREPNYLGFPRVARQRAHLYAFGRQSLRDFAAYRLVVSSRVWSKASMASFEHSSINSV